MSQIELSLDDYQEAADQTRNKDLTFGETLSMLALGIAGEGGEVADHIKKHLYHGHFLDREKVKKELGDVLWYVAILARELQVPLSTIAFDNIQKLKKRYGEKFSSAASINRKIEHEDLQQALNLRDTPEG